MTQRYSKRDAQLAEDWQWLNNTPQGRRIIADLMMWGDAYTKIEESDPIKLAMAVGANNIIKQVSFYLGHRAEPENFATRAWDDTDVVNRMLSSHHQH